MTPSELAADLSSLVASLDGVTGVYDARPAAVAVVAGAVGSLARIAPAHPVLVDERGGTVTVTVAVSVTDDVPAADTSRRVYDGIEAWLASHPEAPPVESVIVRIGHVG